MEDSPNKIKMASLNEPVIKMYIYYSTSLKNKEVYKMKDIEEIKQSIKILRSYRRHFIQPKSFMDIALQSAIDCMGEYVKSYEEYEVLKREIRGNRNAAASSDRQFNKYGVGEWT